MTKERIIMIEGWRFVALFVLLGLMFILAIIGTLAVIVAIVDVWPRVVGTPMKVRIP